MFEVEGLNDVNHWRFNTIVRMAEGSSRFALVEPNGNVSRFQRGK